MITFITAGDPDFDTTEQLVLEMERQGANLIELGVPFSDPIAEGPIIQEASLRSLQGGTTLEGIFELVKKLRTKTEIPLVFMMYINTIYRFGVERFFSLCQETGIDAVIVPDLPFEEHDEIDELLTLMACIQLILSLQRLKTVLLPLRQTAKDFCIAYPLPALPVSEIHSKLILTVFLIQ